MSPRKKANSERTNVFFPPDVIKELKRYRPEKVINALKLSQKSPSDKSIISENETSFKNYIRKGVFL